MFTNSLESYHVLRFALGTADATPRYATNKKRATGLKFGLCLHSYRKLCLEGRKTKGGKDRDAFGYAAGSSKRRDTI